MDIADSFLKFSASLLSGQEGAFFTNGSFIEAQTGKAIACDFDSEVFPIFSVTNFLGTKNISVVFDPVETQSIVSLGAVKDLFAEMYLENFDDFEEKTIESETSFIEKGEEVQKAQKRGEMWVMNLTHALSGPLKDKRFLLAAYYRFLLENPSHVGGVFWTKDLCFVSFSPELFLHQQNDVLKTCPIKGTGDATDLLGNSKERAELYMVTDLLRNDLGQISEKVWVENERAMTSHGDFSHTHSVIKARMKDSYLKWENYKKLLPAGSISGCPKSRVLEYIQKLEGYDRKFYTGTFGVQRSATESVFNILIRTFFVENDSWVYPVGSGITHKSDLKKEWRETLEKAKYLSKYLGG